MPLQFRVWSPGVLMRAGVYDIPVPDGTEIVVPDMAIVPMNGFDARGYRLGYGGGFFDRADYATAVEKSLTTCVGFVTAFGGVGLPGK